MARKDKIEKIRLTLGKQEKESSKKKGETEYFGGRKLILLLFALSILMSLIFWMQGNFKSWLESIFGPSTWVFTK